MVDYRQTVEGSKGGFERLMRHIPGYRGYKEKEDRRAADKLLRDHLFNQLDGLRRRLIDLQGQLMDSSGGLLLMDDMERLLTKVQKLADSIRTATYGFGGLFDAVTVKEDRLDVLYAFDQGMLEHLTNIQTAIESLASAIEAGGDVKAGIKGVSSAADSANHTWRQRQEALAGSGQPAGS